MLATRCALAPLWHNVPRDTANVCIDLANTTVGAAATARLLDTKRAMTSRDPADAT
jgi:hypothetical protein